MSARAGLLALAMIAFVPGAAPAAGGDAIVVPVHAVDSAPAVDGDAGDWAGLAPVTVALSPSRAGATTVLDRVEVAAAHHAGRFYLLARWHDDDEDRLHKPWVWDDDLQRYVRGPQREDRFALQLAMEGDYDTDWFSGRTFVADMWHWKASRSDPLGIAHDKLTRISRDKQLRSARIETPGGMVLYIARPSDAGDPLYRTVRYGRRQEAVMPKYVLSESVGGSVADIAARGVWRDDRWTLELSRALDTGHDDDVVLHPGRDVPAGIAIFDRSENDDHAVSPVLTFRLEADRSPATQ